MEISRMIKIVDVSDGLEMDFVNSLSHVLDLHMIEVSVGVEEFFNLCDKLIVAHRVRVSEA